jgi:hypothetical protein
MSRKGALTIRESGASESSAIDDALSMLDMVEREEEATADDDDECGVVLAPKRPIPFGTSEQASAGPVPRSVHIDVSPTAAMLKILQRTTATTTQRQHPRAIPKTRRTTATTTATMTAKERKAAMRDELDEIAATGEQRRLRSGTILPYKLPDEKKKNNSDNGDDDDGVLCVGTRQRYPSHWHPITARRKKVYGEDDEEEYIEEPLLSPPKRKSPDRTPVDIHDDDAVMLDSKRRKATPPPPPPPPQPSLQTPIDVELEHT